MPICAVFWDYDGTIVDTHEAHWRKHKKVLQDSGILLTEEYRQRVRENNGSQNWEWMHRELGLSMPLQEYLAAIDAQFRLEIPVLPLQPGVAVLLQELQALRIPQAVVTNARRNSVLPVLEAKSLLSYFVFVLCHEDHRSRKPDPAPYLQAMDKMSEYLRKPLNPEDCLVIEDDPGGVVAGSKAGAIVIQRIKDLNMQKSPLARHVCQDREQFIQTVKDLVC